MAADRCSGWRRRHAVQIVAQLPADPEDALRVLDHARSLVENFLMKSGDRAAQGERVVPFRGGVGRRRPTPARPETLASAA